MNLEKLREQFPVTEKVIYLNHAAIGPSPIPVLNECQKWLIEKKAYGDLVFPPLEQFFENLNKDRNIIGQFINAKNAEEEIAFTYNTSYGLSAIAEGITWHKGEKIILNDLEYTSNSYTYQVLAKKYNLEIIIIPNRSGVLSLDSFEQTIDSKTRLVAISHVQFSNGFRINLKKLTKICHENGSEIIVDAIQSLGAIPIDVQAQNIDYLAAGGYKWLLGPAATGIFFVKKDLAEQLNPCFIGSMSDSTPMNLSHHEYIPASGAKRFQASLGPNATLIAKSVQFLDNIGINNIFTHILKLTNIIIEFVENTDFFQLKTSVESLENRSGIINFSCPNGEIITEKLRKLPVPIAISYREGGLRISPHCYNTEEEIQTCMETIKSYCTN